MREVYIPSPFGVLDLTQPLTEMQLDFLARLLIRRNLIPILAIQALGMDKENADTLQATIEVKLSINETLKRITTDIGKEP